jgi:hypothetical protein
VIKLIEQNFNDSSEYTNIFSFKMKFDEIIFELYVIGPFPEWGLSERCFSKLREYFSCNEDKFD